MGSRGPGGQEGEAVNESPGGHSGSQGRKLGKNEPGWSRSPQSSKGEQAGPHQETGTQNTVRRFFRVADKMIAQSKANETQPAKALFVPHHERPVKRSHSAEVAPQKCG